MTEQDEWTEDDVLEIVSDPFYCLATPPMLTEDEWVAVNVKAISDVGAERWLRYLLAVLKKRS